MTDRLYYTDPYLRQFDAIVVSAEARDGRMFVRLDRSAFYPTSGGQPFDTGALGGARVVDVFDETDSPDGDVIHVVDGGAPGAGQAVHGSIDWDRRFDHMQQHTGQHILSSAFDRLSSARTVGFHLGSEASTIDLDRAVSPDEIQAAEREANRIVWEDRPVGIRFADSAEAARLPLRKPPKKAGTLRLIDIEDFDLSACGGTHVARTGGVGLIAVSAWERFKGGLRVEFVCGGRALARFGALRDATAAACRTLSVLPGELAQSIERLQQDLKNERRSQFALQTELARFRADEMVAVAEVIPAGRLVARLVDADASGLKALASAIASRDGLLVVLVSASTPALVVVARSAGLGVRADEVVRALTGAFGGRGGGKPDLAQGGGLAAPADDILAAARKLVTS